MEFLKLFADMEQLFEPFSAEERGNLISAMMAYAFHGTEPTFTGNERFLWPVLKRHIDQCGERAETLRENARKGGRPKTNGNQTKPNETKENQTETKENQTKANETKENLEQEQEQEQEHEQEQEQKEDETRTGDAREWKPRDGGKIIGIDGSDLSDAIRANDAADGMIARFNLPRDIPTREKLLEDIAANGEAVMREVLEEACASNTRERVTARYWRAILQNRGKPKPSRASPEASGYMTGSDHRDDAFWRGLEVDLDAETSRP